QSFGEAEGCVDPKLLKRQHQVFEDATRRGITLFASSGDDGAAQPSCDGSTLILSASSPASDPLVTAVGGTTLNANSTTGAYLGETAWSDSLLGCSAPHCGFSGGGFSNIYHRPFFQVGVPHTHAGHRGVPDVAYNAGVDGGVITFWGVPFGLGAAFIFGGTSSGSPQWAGLAALGDQLAHRRLGFLNPALYRIGSLPSLYSAGFHDITAGTNSIDGITGFNATTHWDAVTGWGTPKARPLLQSVVAVSLLEDGNDGIHDRDAHRHGD